MAAERTFAAFLLAMCVPAVVYCGGHVASLCALVGTLFFGAAFLARPAACWAARPSRRVPRDPPGRVDVWGLKSRARRGVRARRHPRAPRDAAKCVEGSCGSFTRAVWRLLGKQSLSGGRLSRVCWTAEEGQTDRRQDAGTSLHCASNMRTVSETAAAPPQLALCAAFASCRPKGPPETLNPNDRFVLAVSSPASASASACTTTCS